MTEGVGKHVCMISELYGQKKRHEAATVLGFYVSGWIILLRYAWWPCFRILYVINLQERATTQQSEFEYADIS